MGKKRCYHRIATIRWLRGRLGVRERDKMVTRGCLGIDPIERRWFGEYRGLGRGLGFGGRGERRVRVRIERGGDGSLRGEIGFPFLWTW